MSSDVLGCIYSAYKRREINLSRGINLVIYLAFFGKNHMLCPYLRHRQKSTTVSKSGNKVVRYLEPNFAQTDNGPFVS